MTRLVALVTAVLLSIASVSLAGAADSSSSLPVSLGVSEMPATLAKGDSFEIAVATCRAAPGEAVTVERRVAPDGSWGVVRSAALAANGTALFTLRPNSLKAFDFRVRLAGTHASLSPTSRVTVVAASTATAVGTVAASMPNVPPALVSDLPERIVKGTSVPVEIATCPGDPRATVALERRVAPDGSWATVRSGTVDSAGMATFSVRPNSLKSFDFRVRVRGDRPTLTDVQTITVVASDGATSPDATSPAPAESQQSVTVSDLPATMVTGTSVPLTATTDPQAPGAPIVVEKRIEDGEWFQVRSTRLDARGAKTFDLKPIAKRSYGFRVVVGTQPPVTSRAQTITVVGEQQTSGSSSGTNDVSVPRYQLVDNRSDQWLRRGRWIDLHSFATRSGVPTKNIIQLNMNIRAATGDRPAYILVGWSQGGTRVGLQTLAIPSKGGDRPFQVAHDYTAVNGGRTTAQLFIPGSGQVKVTAEVVKAVAHPAQ